jgi:hypothetical protein
MMGDNEHLGTSRSKSCSGKGGKRKEVRKEGREEGREGGRKKREEEEIAPI